jgi:hypothetical protein
MTSPSFTPKVELQVIAFPSSHLHLVSDESFRQVYNIATLINLLSAVSQPLHKVSNERSPGSSLLNHQTPIAIEGKSHHAALLITVKTP